MVMVDDIGDRSSGAHVTWLCRHLSRSGGIRNDLGTESGQYLAGGERCMLMVGTCCSVDTRPRRPLFPFPDKSGMEPSAATIREASKTQAKHSQLRTQRQTAVAYQSRRYSRVKTRLAGRVRQGAGIVVSGCQVGSRDAVPYAKLVQHSVERLGGIETAAKRIGFVTLLPDSGERR